MKLEEFGALIKANELFDLVVADVKALKADFGCKRLVEQQIASADSIAANIEEGFGRGTRREYAQYLIISRGSAQETKGRYGRMKHWLSEKNHSGPPATLRRDHRHPHRNDKNTPS